MLKTIRIAVYPVMDMPGDFTQGVDFLKNVGMVLHYVEVVQLDPQDTTSLVCLASVDTTAHYLR